ncbi:MAG: Lrp/AsnC family transcriptional regulator [Candidatus Micrarchaeota archaeon]|nr:Lrp/AsnC family transcriptional regulator [Candidatus Micrarchaeota archaeon]
MALDVKDRKILYALDRDARQPLAALGKAAGLSKQAVFHRLSRLEKTAIQKYLAIVDLAKLGYTGYKVFLRLQDADPKTERKLLDYLIRHSRVQWLAGTDGAFDVVFNFFARSPEDAFTQLQALDRAFGKYIAERHIVVLLNAQFYTRAYLLSASSSELFTPAFFGAHASPARLDAADLAILGALCHDARMPYVAVAKKAGVSADAVRLRIRKMEKTGVLQHCALVLDNAFLGQQHYKVLLRLHPLDEPRAQELDAFLRAQPNIYFSSRALGPFDAEFNVEVPDAPAFRRILMDFKNRFSGIIKDYSVLTIYQVFKFDFYPMRSGT